LELGMRSGTDALHLGVQLRDSGLLAGVRLALASERVASLARAVLARVGPRAKCRHCERQVYLAHLLRTRGLDERHALLCPRCFSVDQSYWLYSLSEGQQALLPIELPLGPVVEQLERLADAVRRLPFVPAERANATP